MKLAPLENSDHKKGIRDYIKVGRLVVKARLRHADKTFNLGALFQAAAMLLQSPQRQELTTTGRNKLVARKSTDNEKS